MIFPMKDNRQLSGPGITDCLGNGIMKIQVLDVFTFDVNTRSAEHIRITISSGILLAAPAFKAVFPESPGEHQFASFAFIPAVEHNVLPPLVDWH